MASPARVKRFYSEVLEPLFQAEPSYPYSLVFDEWAHYRQLLIDAGISDFRIPRLTEKTPQPPTKIEIKEIDFLIQVIVAQVLRDVSLNLKKTASNTVTGTEAYAMSCFLVLAERYFATGSSVGSVQVSSFEKLADRMTGNYAQILNWACQRLGFFYKTQRSREQQRLKTILTPAATPAAPAVDQRSTGTLPPTQVILKEEYVDRLYSAITQHTVVKDLLEKVNLRLKPDHQVSIDVDGEGKGVFTVGKTEIDLRGLLVRIFIALKPEAELLLSFLVSKVQPNKVNLIELHYENGLAEFEVQMMLEDGLLSQQVHGAINNCSAKTTFPKIVLVCVSVLEEVLGKRVNIFFNRKGEVVVELPEIQERNVKNLAMVLRNKIEEAVQREAVKQDERSDPEMDELRRIGMEMELEMRKQGTHKDSESEATRYDKMIDSDLMRAAAAIQSQERLGMTALAGADDDLEAQLRSYQDDIATDSRARLQAPARLEPPPPERVQTTTTTSWRAAGTASALGEDKLARLEAAFQQTEPSTASQEVMETLLGSDNPVPVPAPVTGQRDLLLNSRSFYRAPREVTMALLTGVRAKNLAQSRNPLTALENQRSDRQLVRNFLETLDEVARECCGQRLEILLPELNGIENFFEIAKKLNEISERQQSRHQRDSALDILLSGAIMASSSIQLTN